MRVSRDPGRGEAATGGSLLAQAAGSTEKSGERRRSQKGRGGQVSERRRAAVGVYSTKIFLSEDRLSSSIPHRSKKDEKK